MKWFVRYDRRYARDGFGNKMTVEADTAEEALAKARKRFLLRNPRLVEVFNHHAPVPDTARADEGRAWWMAQGY